MQTRAHGLAIIAIGTSILIAACSTSATPPASVPAAPATSSPSPSSVAVDTAWIAPKAGARIDSYSLTLSATAPTDTVRSMKFATVADKRSITLCSAGAPVAGTTWSCTADLLELGIAPGKLSLMFSTVDRAGKIIDEPDGEISVTYAVAPPRPAQTNYAVVKVTNIAATDTDVVENLATWIEPEGYASTFRVYGVTGCIREAADTDQTPCVLGDTKIPKGALTLLGTLPGTARGMKITERHQGIGGGGYSAIVVEASNDYGTSPFGVITSTPVCWQCVY
jgi:hypothetical protein